MNDNDIALKTNEMNGLLVIKQRNPICNRRISQAKQLPSALGDIKSSRKHDWFFLAKTWLVFSHYHIFCSIYFHNILDGDPMEKVACINFLLREATSMCLQHDNIFLWFTQETIIIDYDYNKRIYERGFCKETDSLLTQPLPSSEFQLVFKWKTY